MCADSRVSKNCGYYQVMGSVGEREIRNFCLSQALGVWTQCKKNNGGEMELVVASKDVAGIAGRYCRS
jgi:hypothetical protein